jgi:peptidoglycan-associated lipoprotein
MQHNNINVLFPSVRKERFMKRLSMASIIVLAVLVTAPVFIGACGPKGPTQQEIAAIEAERHRRAQEDSVRAAAEETRLAAEAEERRMREEEDRRRREAEEASRRAEEEARRMAMLSSVYFDYDESDLRADQMSSMSENARRLREYKPEENVLIEGHCDERGTVEYNLALGEQRANTIKTYLSDGGVMESRIETISYGEERPAAMGHDENSWSKNRRAELTRK